MRKRSKIYEYIEKLKEKRKKRTDKSESPFLLDFPAELIDAMDIKPKKKEEERSEFNPILPRYYKGYDIDILYRKKEDGYITKEEAFVLKEARDHYYRELSTRSYTQTANRLYPAVHKGKSTSELFEKIEKNIPLTEEENAFYDELFYEYVEKPHKERAELMDKIRTEAIKAGKIVPPIYLASCGKFRPIEEVSKDE